jgi:hypothetical protein
VNAIGPFLFRSLRGNCEPLKQHLVAEARAGVPGVAIWRQGYQGRPFSLRSSDGVLNLAAGRGLFLQYTQLIGYGAVPIAWAGLDLSAEGFCAVLDVRQVSLRPVLLDTAGAGAILECDWDLVMVGTPSE